jgi:hypothetical protein
MRILLAFLFLTVPAWCDSKTEIGDLNGAKFRIDVLGRWNSGLVMYRHMESAGPIVRVDDLPTWWRRGLRLIVLTYGDTKYDIGPRR